MKKILFLSLLLRLGLPVQAADLQPNVAYADDHVRFTVISDGAVRLEYAPDGRFVDDKSFVAVERAYPAADYRVKRGAWIEIATPKMIVRYRKGSGEFSAANLSIRSPKSAAVPFAWKPGMRQQGNLKGTFRTLDRYDGDYDTRKKQTMPIEDGLLATDGWTLIDDSRNFLFDGDPEWEWVRERPANGSQDWYFLAYGHDYKAALKDFTLFAGKMPLPPRYAFGYWWSRYWAYSDHELRSLIDKFETYSIPLDVLVIDMDWHYADGVKGDWTGWTWNRRLFPDYRKFLKYLQEKDLKITLNLHPARGVRPYEEKYADVARDTGIDPASKQTVEWLASDKRLMNTMFRHILTPMEQAGVDFWWLDWQQHPTDRKIEGLSNTWWINYIFFTQMEKSRETRPMLYHRWGGLGNHRYQIGFSGDAIISWKSLDFQPWFNSTASNVLYGYWSHDLGGHMLGRIEPEMYVRWMQFGALSPIMRTHSTKDPALNKELWGFEAKITDILRQTVLQRYALAPYIYTMARTAYDEGLSLCRPMYYDWPEAPEAYSFRNQYMFGDGLLVAPITAPGTGGYSTLRVWLPEGEWYEQSSGTLLRGGQVIERDFALDEYPLYVRAGAVVPMYSGRVKNLRRNDEAVTLAVFPGGDGSFSLYEDNGDDKHYAAEYARTPLKSVREGNTLTVTIGRREGSYRGMPAVRSFTVKAVASALPESVTVDGRPAEWHYDSRELAVVICLGERPCDTESVVEVRYAAGAEHPVDGVLGKMHRMAEKMIDVKFAGGGAKVQYNDELGPMGSIFEAIDYAPEQCAALLEEFRRSYADLPAVLQRQEFDDESREWLLKAVNWQK